MKLCHMILCIYKLLSLVFSTILNPEICLLLPEIYHILIESVLVY